MNCSFFRQRMESSDHQGGDLGDIIRATAFRGGALANQSAVSIAVTSEWKLPPEALNLSPAPPGDGFGNPFSTLPDPLLHELAGTPTTTSPLFNSSDSMGKSSGLVMMGVEGGDDGCGGSSTLLAARKIFDEEMGRPVSVFSRVLQISPSTNVSPIAPRGFRPSLPSILVGDMMKMGGNSSDPAVVCCPPDHGGVQISSPPTPGIKRRKSQAKKVVCIPAPAAAGGRPTGEVVPSDLWAWRKYGQKPIKGSPYPRGYYRCSSSKGCPARKQVERSRTDPSMLVITYTSEHNHPWPTQRNALAGSTRSQPTKNSKNSSSNNEASTPSWNEELKDNNAASMSTPVKEEAPETMELASMDPADDNELEHVFSQSCYKPMFPGSASQFDDFFADLGELDTHPMDLVFSMGFLGERGDEEIRTNKALDPFNMLDWGGNSLGDQAKKGGV